MLRNLLQDVRFGFRVLSGSPGFAAVAVLTLGLGIASTTTVFSWIDAVILHPYPGTSHPRELAALEMVTPGAPNGGTAISWLDYRDYRDHLKGLAGLAVRRQCAFTLGDGQTPQLAWGELVSGNYFEVMGVKPQLGRVFTREESGDSVGAYPVVVISGRLWRRYFHSDPRIVGKTVRVNRHALTIVGVVPAEFRGASPIMQFDFWVPVTMGPTLGLLSEPTFRERGSRGMLSAICRRRAGVGTEQARAEAMALAASLAAAHPKTNRGVGATILPTWEEHNGINGTLRGPLTILLGFSFVVLLIVCANVANLLLARSVGRQREFAIRCALGAGRIRVAFQVLTETLVLAAAGAGVGILMLLWMQGSLLAITPSVGFPISVAYAVSGRILGFTALACVTAALISGTAPALFVFRSNLNEVLKEGSRSDTGGAASRRTRNLLAIGEVALATVALVGAGLFMRSFHNVSAIHPGFEAGKVLFGRFFIESTGYRGEQVEQFALRLKQRMLAAPGVETVSYSDFVPLSSTAGPYHSVRVEGYTPAQGEATNVNRALVAPGYFATMRIPLLEGRDFTARDERTGEAVMIVNQAFAKRFFHGQNPVGRKVGAAGKECTVVGMARDSKYFSPEDAPSPYFYLPFQQFYNASAELYFLVRTAGEPAQSIPLMRRAVTETDPNAAAFHPVPLAEYTQVATFGQKVAANLMAALGLMCLMLAAIGLYSVMSYTVSQRIGEIGIRMAMGARPRNVIAMVVGQGMGLALAGMAVGTVAAFFTTRLVASMLFRVDAADPATFVVAGLFLGVVALIATWLPAFRATRIDPMSALRR
ncbi:MAG: ABC transporter permease [Candidatus Solibacter sp.]|nr:ABC transporter permease [Candidatus Solibacter sp.]